MTEKEQIIINGVFINACLVSEKCKEFETCKIKNILRQLSRKTQECEELKRKNTILQNRNQQLDSATTEANRYRNALEEIEGICLQDRDISDVCLISTRLETPRCKYDIQDEILDIISKAKGEE